METTKFLNTTPRNLFGVKETAGMLFGVELELEGRGVGLPDVPTKGWQRHHEPSLRGDSIEFTTNGAQTFEQTKKLVEGLFKKFKDNNVLLNNSFRTSTHVHLNFSDKTLKEAIKFFSLFTVFEEILGYYCGEDRRGNVFCVSSREAEGVVDILIKALKKGDFRDFAGDRFKYAACNLSTLYKFGTVEVRTMRGASSPEQINRWLSILNDMYLYSINKVKTPADLVSKVSFLGADGLLRDVFSKENYEELMKEYPAVLQGVDFSVMEGARLIQVMAYEFEDNFQEEFIFKPEVGLSYMIPEGPNAHTSYCVYKLDGEFWFCSPIRRDISGRWQDGQGLVDDNRIKWSEKDQRFIQLNPRTREWVALNWRLHHEIPDEGPLHL